MPIGQPSVWDYISLKTPVLDLDEFLDARLWDARTTIYGKHNITLRTDILGRNLWPKNDIPTSAIVHVPASVSPQKNLRDGFIIIFPYRKDGMGWHYLNKTPLVQLTDMKMMLDETHDKLVDMEMNAKTLTAENLMDTLIYARESLERLERPFSKMLPETMPKAKKVEMEGFRLG